MNTEETSIPPPAAEPAKLTRTPEPSRTKSQIRAATIADGLAVKAKWKTLVAEASALWQKVHPADLAKVDGNFHKLAGLVQLRYQISRQESDKQVREFLDKHYAVA